MVGGSAMKRKVNGERVWMGAGTTADCAGRDESLRADVTVGHRNGSSRSGASSRSRAHSTESAIAAKPQQQTLSVRISDTVRMRLERAKHLIASKTGTRVSTSEIAKQF